MIELEDKAASVYVDVKGGEVTANITPAHDISVTVGQSAQIDATAAVNYIESGKAEIRPLVDETKGYKNEAAASATSAAADADRAEAAAESVVSDKTFVFEQGEASDTWEIEHNLGKFPSVEIVDTAGNRFFPAVQWIDENNCIATMNGACKGKAFLN